MQLGLSPQRKDSVKARYDILTAANMKITVLCDVKPYGPPKIPTRQHDITSQVQMLANRVLRRTSEPYRPVVLNLCQTVAQ